ncbi:unnamed protein product, partial [Scytosiphon promiscuus]
GNGGAAAVVTAANVPAGEHVDASTVRPADACSGSGGNAMAVNAEGAGAVTETVQEASRSPGGEAGGTGVVAAAPPGGDAPAAAPPSVPNTGAAPLPRGPPEASTPASAAVVPPAPTVPAGSPASASTKRVEGLETRAAPPTLVVSENGVVVAPVAGTDITGRPAGDGGSSDAPHASSVQNAMDVDGDSPPANVAASGGGGGEGGSSSSCARDGGTAAPGEDGIVDGAVIEGQGRVPPPKQSAEGPAAVEPAHVAAAAAAADAAKSRPASTPAASTSADSSPPPVAPPPPQQ